MNKQKLHIFSVILLTGIFLFINTKAHAQHYEWVKAHIPGNMAIEYITNDSAGNTYASGWWSFSAQITVGPSVIVGHNTAAGFWDGILIKYDPQGNILWAKGMGTPMHDELRGVTVDKEGNIYLSASTEGFGIQESFTYTLDGLSVTTANDEGRAYYIAKLSSDGDAKWLKLYGKSNFISIDDDGFARKGFRADDDGNLYVTGKLGCCDTLLMGATDSLYVGETDFTVQTEIYTAKLDSSGNPIWAKQSHSGYSPHGYGISWGHGVATDNEGNVFSTGEFQGEARFYYDATHFATIVAEAGSGTQDMYVAKYAPDGQFLWVQQGGADTWGDENVSVETDGNGNCYIAFPSKNTTTFYSDTTFNNPVSYSTAAIDNFLVKYNSLGDLKWVKREIGSGGYTGDANSTALSVDKYDNIFVASKFYGTLTFDNGTLVAPSNNGYKNIAVAAYDTLGNLQWKHRVGNTQGANPSDISVDKNGNLYMITQGFGTVGTPVQFNGPTDYSVPGPSDIEITTACNPCVSKFATQNSVGISAANNPGFSVYPNPATRNVTIETATGKGIYQVTDITGKTLLQGTATSSKFTLDISALSSGVYFISVSDEEKQVFGKVVKE